MLLMFVCIGFFFMPQLPNLIYDIRREPLLTSTEPYLDPSQRVILFFFFFLYDLHIQWDLLLPLFYLPLLYYGIKTAWTKKDTPVKHTAVILTFIVAFAYVAIYALTHSNRMRYYAPFSFPILLFLAYGIRSVTARKNVKLIVAVWCGIGIFNTLNFSDFFRNYMQENWKRTASLIKEIPGYRDKDMVFVFPCRYNPPVLAHYLWGDAVARRFVRNISSNDSYEGEMANVSSRHKICVIDSGTTTKDLFKLFETIPDSTLVWVIRYHDRYFPSEFCKLNDGSYYLYRLPLGEGLKPIDVYLVKRYP